MKLEEKDDELGFELNRLVPYRRDDSPRPRQGNRKQFDESNKIMMRIRMETPNIKETSNRRTTFTTTMTTVAMMKG